MTTPATDSVIDDLERWLVDRGHRHEGLTPLVGDVSPRRYVRVDLASGRSVIAACYPEALLETGRRFLATGELLAAAGVPVPEVFDWDEAAGIMLVSDAGGRSLQDAAGDGDGVESLWRRVLPIVQRLGRLDRAVVGRVNRPLDGKALRRELVQSWDLLLEPAGLVGDSSLSADLRLALFGLCDRLAEPAARPCHRDFMARNLLLSSAGDIVVIDHQDLRLGPPWYDLASLLNDTLYATAEQETELLDLARVPRPEREWYHRAAAQRALKIVGTFTAFAKRGVTRHLPLVPPAIVAAKRHLERLPETASLMAELAPAWLEFAAARKVEG